MTHRWRIAEKPNWFSVPSTLGTRTFLNRVVAAMIFSKSTRPIPPDAEPGIVGHLCRSKCQRSVCVNHVSESTKPESNEQTIKKNYVFFFCVWIHRHRRRCEWKNIRERRRWENEREENTESDCETCELTENNRFNYGQERNCKIGKRFLPRAIGVIIFAKTFATWAIGESAKSVSMHWSSATRPISAPQPKNEKENKVVGI